MSKFEDRFHLTPEQSLFLAKKKWDENVYCGMKMENRAVTFPQTQTILNGVNVPNVQLDDIQAILNMRDAWKFLLGTVNEEVTFEYLVEKNPGYIFVIDRNSITGSKDITAQSIIENELTKQTDAYKNGNIIYLNPSIWYTATGGFTSTMKMVEEIDSAIK